MDKTIIFDTSIPNKSFQIRTPREYEIQECLDTAKREGCQVELRWTIGDEIMATYVLPDSTMEEIRKKVDYDTYGATKLYLEKVQKNNQKG